MNGIENGEFAVAKSQRSCIDVHANRDHRPPYLFLPTSSGCDPIVLDESPRVAFTGEE
jgi:hypothetical protein